jgi:hypothetical protein
MRPLRCLETSVRDYHWTLCNTPEEQRFHEACFATCWCKVILRTIMTVSLYTTDLHHWCTPLMYTTEVHHWCTPLMYTTEVHHWCTPLKYTTDVHHWCTPLMYTTDVHHWCTPLMYTALNQLCYHCRNRPCCALKCRPDDRQELPTDKKRRPIRQCSQQETAVVLSENHDTHWRPNFTTLFISNAVFLRGVVKDKTNSLYHRCR